MIRVRKPFSLKPFAGSVPEKVFVGSVREKFRPRGVAVRCGFVV